MATARVLLNAFKNGLKVILPLALTIGVIYWLCAAIERFFGYFLKLIMGPYYVPGLGLLLGIILTFLIGLLMNAWLGRKIGVFGEQLLLKIPFVRWLYGSFKDLITYFESRKEKGKQNVVMVSIGPFRLMGLVTRDDYSDLPEGVGTTNEVSVYLPMAYQIGGYMVNVPKEALQPVAMSVEQAMRYTVTAGMTGKGKGTAERKI